MSCEIPALALQSRLLRATIHGDYFNNKGSSGVITFRGKMIDSGGTETVTAALTVAARAARQNFIATFTVTPTATNAQTVFLAVENSLDGNLYEVSSFTMLEAEGLTLEFTAQLDAADADFECRRFSAQVEAI